MVRVSGPAAFDVASRLTGRQVDASLAGRFFHSVFFKAPDDLKPSGLPLDDGLVLVFAAPNSYTGENVVEFQCHGGSVAPRRVLEACLSEGARLARRGEFTQRAFLNGRMDLLQAEAVVDLVDAETAEAARNAAGQVDGALRRLAESAYDKLLDIASRFYAVVDYPDEDIEDASPAEVEATLRETEAALADLLATYARGRFVKSGVATAIIGAPNAGKSSLLNRLVGYDRAIVTDIAGTTRDTVEEKALVGGVLLRLIDTAGLRETDDAVEKLGVERSRRAIESADLILALVDGSRPRTAEDAETLTLAKESGKPYLLLRSKRDLGGSGEGIGISNTTGEGFDALEAAVAALFPTLPPTTGTLLTNARQADAVTRALASVRAALSALCDGMTPDAVLTEVEAASNALGELTGRTAREDMVARIFERFCVGK